MSAALPVSIRALESPREAELCARWMATSEPWITLRRDFAHSLELISDPRAEVYVALRGNEPAGFILVDMNGSFAGYIRVLIVGEAFRGQGCGEQLLRFAEQRIFRDSPNVFLCVSECNPKAQAFYRRMGYETIGELKHYVIKGASEFLMRKTIGAKSDFRPASSNAS